MISDFLILLPSTDKQNNRLFDLLLPDINDEDDDSICKCGIVEINTCTKSGFEDIHIFLNDDFLALSEGESYSRDALIESVMVLLQKEIGSLFPLSDVYLNDYMGEYKISLYE